MSLNIFFKYFFGKILEKVIGKFAFTTNIPYLYTHPPQAGMWAIGVFLGEAYMDFENLGKFAKVKEIP